MGVKTIPQLDILIIFVFSQYFFSCKRKKPQFALRLFVIPLGFEPRTTTLKV